MSERVIGIIATAEEHRLREENVKLRAALTRIAAYETDWTVGPAENVGHLQGIAEGAIATPSPTGEAPTPGPRPTFGYQPPLAYPATFSECGPIEPPATPPDGARCATWCGLIHDQAPRGVSQYLTALPSDNRLHAFCSCDCMLAGRHINPTPPPDRGTP